MMRFLYAFISPLNEAHYESVSLGQHLKKRNKMHLAFGDKIDRRTTLLDLAFCATIGKPERKSRRAGFEPATFLFGRRKLSYQKKEN
jgi:hypothetical protein